MGGTRSSATDWAAYSSSTATRSATFDSAYSRRGTGGINPDYHPRNIKVRESVASDANPHPTPIIIALDCTGSMNDLALSAVKNIGTLMAQIYERAPVSDPHVMAMFFDDVITSYGDALQATQFEADQVIIDQLKDLSFIGRGGGNNSESSGLPLFFAVNKTACDAFKEGRKGFIFLIGDDGPPPPLDRRQLIDIFGSDFDPGEEQSFETLLAQAQENWHVFNVIPTRGRDPSYWGEVYPRWQKVLGERVIILEDINKLAEVLVATMQVVSGADAATVAASFTDPGTSLVVANAIRDLAPTSGGVVRL